MFGLIFGIILISGVPFVFADSHWQHEGEWKLVVLETTSGDIVLELFPEDAPNHVTNFINLVESGYYDKTLFHRVIDGFMIQGGDPYTTNLQMKDKWGTGGPDHRVDAEFNDIKHDRGILSMARSQDPNSAGSQFFIVHKKSYFLDGQYTVFGRIITAESYFTLDKIGNLETGDRDVPLNLEEVEITWARTMYRGAAENYPNEFVLLDRPPPLRTSDPGPTQTFTPPSASSNSPTSSTDIDGQPFESKQHGIKFNIPDGWNLQQPPKTSAISPDFVALGPTTGTIPPAITLTITNTDGKTFDEVVEAKKAQLEKIEEGLDVKYNRITTINGKDVNYLMAQGTFDYGEETLIVIFIETIIYDTEKVYTFSSISDDLAGVAEQNELLDLAVNSFEILPEGDRINQVKDLLEEDKIQNEEGGGCLIATAAYGSEMASQVQFLREIRDGKIMTTQSGTAFMTGFNQFYYSFSPAVADYERENPMFKEAVKITLTPLLTSLAILNYVEIDTEQEMLGYGIGVILLNIGMYFVAPAAVIIAIKNRRK
jgi:peptidyl-prolyl cis-trans isomerase B (cyclophilin B)